jgi:hypothetical protein
MRLVTAAVLAAIGGTAYAGDTDVNAGAISGSNSRSNSDSNAAAISSGGNASQGQQQGQTQRSNSTAIQGQDASNRNTIIIKSPGVPTETTTNINNDTNVHGTQSIKSAPPLGLGNLSPTTPCSNTYQLGVSGMGFGVGAGGVVVDADCTRREYARILWAMGAQEAAVGILCQNEELRKVAPVMCRKANDDLGAGNYPNQDLPAYPSTKPVPPPTAQPKMSEAPSAPVVVGVEVKPSNVPQTAAVVGNPPGRSSGPQQGDIVMGNDGAKYKLVGQAWVKIVNDRQPMVPPAKMFEARNTYDGKDVEVVK